MKSRASVATEQLSAVVHTHLVISRYVFCHGIFTRLYSQTINQRPLSHDQDTVHAENGCAEMCHFCMVAFMFLTNDGIKVRALAHAEIIHFPTRCIIRTRKALTLQPHASQALTMHLVGKCMISAWAWVLAILSLFTVTICDVGCHGNECSCHVL